MDAPDFIPDPEEAEFFILGALDATWNAFFVLLEPCKNFGALLSLLYRLSELS